MQPLCCFISSRAREQRAYSPLSNVHLMAPLFIARDALSHNVRNMP
jgi:hypothetical protein